MQVAYSAEAAEQFIDLPIDIQRRVNDVVERLRNWPQVSGAKPLRHGLAGHFRIRTGDYRVQFVVGRQRIVIVKVGHRRGFYDD